MERPTYLEPFSDQATEAEVYRILARLKWLAKEMRVEIEKLAPHTKCLDETKKAAWWLDDLQAETVELAERDLEEADMSPIRLAYADDRSEYE